VGRIEKNGRITHVRLPEETTPTKISTKETANGSDITRKLG
jgi:hypothetical protein